MDRTELKGKLEEWCEEFARFSGGHIPSSLVEFLANRLIESGVGGIQEDWDVLRALVGEKWRRVRIVSRHAGGMFNYVHADGSVGMGIVPVRKIHPDDNSKLAVILDRLEGSV